MDYGYVRLQHASAAAGPFPNLKPSLKSISIRIPSDMLAELKALARKIDVPYQSLAKVYLARQYRPVPAASSAGLRAAKAARKARART